MTTVSVELSGQHELERKLAQLSKAAASSIAKDAVDEGSAVIVFHAQNNALTAFSDNQRGQLRNSIRSESRNTGSGAEAEVGPHVIYGRIQELGGKIFPRPGGYLKFQIDGQWRTIKYGSKVRDHVEIRPHPYLRPAVEDHIQQISQVMKETVEDGINNAV